MATRNVVLTERQQKLIESLVRSGRYQNASEVVRDGLRLIEIREAEEAAKLVALREAAVIGIADLDRGAYKEFAESGQLNAYLDDLANRVLSDA